MTIEKNRKRISRTTGRSDVYTLLMVIAMLALVIGIGFVWHRGTALYDSPLEIAPVAPSGRPAAPLP